jgi:3-deoxy-D-manno-octulosonate 8-phosphate phosphatase (KDO 8-P phosphatase)
VPLNDKISKIKIVLTDIDGVLTDGGLYYTDEGLVMKKFFVRDGMGAVLLKENGLEVGILSSDKSEIATARGKRLNLELVYYGVKDKRQVLDEICFLRNVKMENLAFIGDDVNDVEALKAVGLSACPKDAVESIGSIVDYVCQKEGGRGAFRELADLILNVERK